MRNSGIILYPTDTIWGIGCDATNEAAVDKVYRLKNRPDEKALIILVTEERDIIQHVAAVDLSVFDYLKTCSKPTTVIYDNPIGLADNLTGGSHTIAIRICQDPFCRALIKRLKRPLVSTSANLAGEPSPTHFGDVSAAIRDGVDYIVTHRQDNREPAQPSAVVRWNADGTVTVIRA